MQRVRCLIFSLLCAFLLWPPGAVDAQQRQISGQVLGEFGEPIPFALVEVVGQRTGTQTDQQGRFDLNVPTGEVELRVESFGYRTRTVTVGPGESSLQIRLTEDVLNLDEIVVTGQATSVRRRNLANAVSSVSAAQIEEAPPAASIENFLQGKVVGASIEQNSGAPGGGIQVRLRGVSTINGELEPLYIVDGVIVSNISIPSAINNISLSGGGSNGSNQDDPVNRIADINPQDIQSIEILKGASAAALYGSRAANGVVIIQTKRGQPGDRRISVTQRFGTFDLANKFEFRDWTRQEALDAGLVDEQNVGQFFDASGNAVNAIDMEEELAGGNPLSWETQASVSGGTDDTQYFLSGSWKKDDGIIDRTGFQRQSLRMNLNQVFSDRFRANTTTNLIRTKARRGLTNNDNSGTSYYMVFPFTPSFIDLTEQPDETFPRNPFERSNPFETVALFDNDEAVWRLIGSADLEFDLLDRDDSYLRLLGTAGVDWFQQKNDLFAPPELQFEPNDGLAGTSILSNSEARDVTLSGNMVYFRAGDDYRSTATVGVQFEDRDQDISRTIAQGLTAGQKNINSGVQTTVVQQRQIVRDLGFFGQEELLLFGERLLLSAGIRADRSSVNGDPNQFFWYPKAAGSYRFDEPFDSDLVSALKLRVAWGHSGNQPLFGQKFTPLTATGNISGIPGLVVQGVAGDPNLQPEQQSEVEGGFDLTLWDGRTQFEATAFQKDISDLILQRTPAPSTGFVTEVFNGGEARVRGLELALSASPILSQDLQWVTGVTYFRDYSKVLSLPVPAFETGGFGTGLGAFRIEEGASMTQIVSTVGQDANGDPIVENVGDATPTFRMGFNNDVTWGPISLGSVVDWSEGNSVINLTRLLADAGQNSADYVDNVQPRTLSDADGTQMELGDGAFRLLNWAIGDDTRGYIEDASYVKLRELSLRYQLPERFVAGLFGGSASSATLTVSGRNLVTITDYTGLDPEVSNFGNQAIARNIDVAPFPPSRSFWLAMNVIF